MTEISYKNSKVMKKKIPHNNLQNDRNGNKISKMTKIY